jgi:hypothetical protein
LDVSIHKLTIIYKRGELAPGRHKVPKREILLYCYFNPITVLSHLTTGTRTQAPGPTPVTQTFKKMSKTLNYVRTGLQELEKSLIEGIEDNSLEKIPHWKIEMVSLVHLVAL